MPGDFPTKYPILSPTRLPRVHDPQIVRAGELYFLFSTGRGIPVWVSEDRDMWHWKGRVFAEPVPWAVKSIPGSTDCYWAPSISFYRGRWHLYYSVSTFGNNRSAIGLATCAVLDPERPGADWRDEGVAVESRNEDDYNAIDPDLFVDDDGQAWLTFGSFWSGIKLVPVDPASGMLPDPTSTLVSLARRPSTPELQGSVEAPCLIKRGEYYYLFVSFDFCCRGILSTYNIRVGRSRRVTGPFADRAGIAMLDGSGTLLLAGNGRWAGPGHTMVLQDRGEDWLVYHAYDAHDHGLSKLRISKLNWDEDGWPHSSSED